MDMRISLGDAALHFTDETRAPQATRTRSFFVTILTRNGPSWLITTGNAGLPACSLTLAISDSNSVR